MRSGSHRVPDMSSRRVGDEVGDFESWFTDSFRHKSAVNRQSHNAILFRIERTEMLLH